MTELTTKSHIEHFDDVDSLDEANQAAIDQGMALRIQPPAPAATRYYYHENGQWYRQKCGHSHASTVDVEAARQAVKRAMKRNDSKGGGGVKAVKKSLKDKYA